VTCWSVVISGYSRILHPKKTDYKDITEILLKVALNTIILTPLHENVLGLNSISAADRKIMFPPLFYYFMHSFNSFFRKMIFKNFETSSPRKINSQIIEIFNYLNISPIIIKNKIFLVVVRKWR
jgi:hypothetical protein